jgi:hypothetical protein
MNATIGGSFLLKATAPGDFAAAYFELGTDQRSPGTINTLLGFSIGIDSTTQSLSGLDYEFSAFDPSIGFATPGAFEQYLNGFLTFDITPAGKKLIQARSGTE